LAGKAKKKACNDWEVGEEVREEKNIV